MSNYVQDLDLIRKQKSLIHNITNYVVMNFTANILLACGASPVMAHANEEVEDMVAIASALVINMGTLSPHWVSAMIKAGKKANQKGVPVVFDPVGSGATKYRTETAKKILDEVKVTVLRGNASEILSLISADAKTKGVDSLNKVEEVQDMAKDFAQKKGLIAAITGQVDFVTNGKDDCKIYAGHEMMGKITGSGCAATALIGAFCAVNKNYLEATVNALQYFGECGERAAKRARGIGSFIVELLDEIGR